jgi:hypothetical protein
MNILRVILAIVIIFGGSVAKASQEGLLPLTSFQIQSAGTGETGSVSVSGSVGDNGLAELDVTAFGKHFTLNREQLQKLRGLDVNGCQLSFEHGYKELGGRTLYVKLTKGFTSGISRAATVVIKENGALTLDLSH